jgi:hypothetical protein
VETLGEMTSDAPHATSSSALVPTTAGASPRRLCRRTTITTATSRTRQSRPES